MRSNPIPVLALGLVLAVHGSGFAGQSPDHDAPIPTTALGLSPDLQQLLKEEMKAIQAGMQSLVPDIAAGNWTGIAKTGEQLQNTYLFRQQLTEAQRQELQTKLPPAFRELDQSFHGDAGMLAHAARMKNADVLVFYYSRLINGCVACHTKFATQRFPGFSADQAPADHDH